MLLTQKRMKVVATNHVTLAELANETLDRGLHLFPPKEKPMDSVGGHYP
jgi:hypothetical protein